MNQTKFFKDKNPVEKKTVLKKKGVNKKANVHVKRPGIPSRKTHQGAVTTNNPNMCFAVRHAPAKAVENNMSQTDTRAFHRICANQAQDMKYIMVVSGATTSCANQCSFPGAVLGPTKTKELWAINGTPIANAGEMTAGTNLTAVTTSGECKSIPATFRLDATDTTEPVIALCRILDEADCDLHFYRSSSGKSACIQTPDGNTIHLPRFGARFYLPYQDRLHQCPQEIS